MGRLVMARALAQRRAPPRPRAPDALVGVLGSSTARFASRQLWSADGGFQGTLLSLVTQADGVRAVGRGSGRRARPLPRLRKKSCQRTVSGPPQRGSERVSERFEGAQVARTVRISASAVFSVNMDVHLAAVCPSPAEARSFSGFGPEVPILTL